MKPKGVILISPTLKTKGYAGTDIQLAYEAIPGLIANSPLIVNATPLGMYPDTEKYPDIPYRLLDSGHFLFDLIYNPASTLFMEKGRARGSEVKNGTDMFGYQAEYAWKIWENFPG